MHVHPATKADDISQTNNRTLIFRQQALSSLTIYAVVLKYGTTKSYDLIYSAEQFDAMKKLVQTLVGR